MFTSPDTHALLTFNVTTHFVCRTGDNRLRTQKGEMSNTSVFSNTLEDPRSQAKSLVSNLQFHTSVNKERKQPRHHIPLEKQPKDPGASKRDQGTPQKNSKSSLKQPAGDQQTSDGQPRDQRSEKKQPRHRRMSDQQPIHRRTSDDKLRYRKMSDVDRRTSDEQSRDRRNSDKQSRYQRASKEQSPDRKSSDVQPKIQRVLEKQPGDQQSSEKTLRVPEPKDQDNAGTKRKRLNDLFADLEPAAKAMNTREESVHPLASVGESSTSPLTRSHSVSTEHDEPVADTPDDDDDNDMDNRWPDDSQVVAATWSPQSHDIDFDKVFAPPPSHNPPRGGKRKRTAHASTDEIHAFRQAAPTFRQSTTTFQQTRLVVSKSTSSTVHELTSKSADLLNTIMGDMNKEHRQ